MSSSTGKNIVVRTLSGAALLAIVLVAVLASEYTFLMLALTISLGSMYEFFQIAAVKGVKVLRGLAMVVGALVVILSFFMAKGCTDSLWATLLIPCVALFFIVELYRRNENPLTNISVALGGILYAALPLALLCFIAFAGGSYRPETVLSIIFIVWVNDIFAFLVGTAIGKHRLFERISPKKSWEGFFGGVVFASLFAVGCGRLSGGNELIWAGLGAVTAVSAVYGDLVESMFKRSAGLKDSGNILPGHGGFMDRFDALLLSLPFVFVYFIIFAL